MLVYQRVRGYVKITPGLGSLGELGRVWFGVLGFERSPMRRLFLGPQGSCSNGIVIETHLYDSYHSYPCCMAVINLSF